MIMTICALIESAGLIGKCEFLNQLVLGQQVQRAINGAICNRWVSLLHSLEDFTCGQMTIGSFYLLQDDGPLSGIAIGPSCNAGHVYLRLLMSKHFNTICIRNDSYMRIILDSFAEEV